MTLEEYREEHGAEPHSWEPPVYEPEVLGCCDYCAEDVLSSEAFFMKVLETPQKDGKTKAERLYVHRECFREWALDYYRNREDELAEALDFEDREVN